MTVIELNRRVVTEGPKPVSEQAPALEAAHAPERATTIRENVIDQKAPQSTQPLNQATDLNLTAGVKKKRTPLADEELERLVQQLAPHLNQLTSADIDALQQAVKAHKSAGSAFETTPSAILEAAHDLMRALDGKSGILELANGSLSEKSRKSLSEAVIEKLGESGAAIEVGDSVVQAVERTLQKERTLAAAKEAGRLAGDQEKLPPSAENIAAQKAFQEELNHLRKLLGDSPEAKQAIERVTATRDQAQLEQIALNISYFTKLAVAREGGKLEAESRDRLALYLRAQQSFIGPSSSRIEMVAAMQAQALQEAGKLKSSADHIIKESFQHSRGGPRILMDRLNPMMDRCSPELLEFMRLRAESHPRGSVIADRYIAAITNRLNAQESSGEGTFERFTKKTSVPVLSERALSPDEQRLADLSLVTLLSAPAIKESRIQRATSLALLEARLLQLSPEEQQQLNQSLAEKTGSTLAERVEKAALLTEYRAPNVKKGETGHQLSFINGTSITAGLDLISSNSQAERYQGASLLRDNIEPLLTTGSEEDRARVASVIQLLSGKDPTKSIADAFLTDNLKNPLLGLISSTEQRTEIAHANELRNYLEKSDGSVVATHSLLLGLPEESASMLLASYEKVHGVSFLEDAARHAESLGKRDDAAVIRAITSEVGANLDQYLAKNNLPAMTAGDRGTVLLTAIGQATVSELEQRAFTEGDTVTQAAFTLRRSEGAIMAATLQQEALKLAPGQEAAVLARYEALFGKPFVSSVQDQAVALVAEAEKRFQYAQITHERFKRKADTIAAERRAGEEGAREFAEGNFLKMFDRNTAGELWNPIIKGVTNDKQQEENLREEYARKEKEINEARKRVEDLKLSLAKAQETQKEAERLSAAGRTAEAEERRRNAERLFSEVATQARPAAAFRLNDSEEYLKAEAKYFQENDKVLSRIETTETVLRTTRTVVLSTATMAVPGMAAANMIRLGRGSQMFFKAVEGANEVNRFRAVASNFYSAGLVTAAAAPSHLVEQGLEMRYGGRSLGEASKGFATGVLGDAQTTGTVALGGAVASGTASVIGRGLDIAGSRIGAVALNGTKTTMLLENRAAQLAYQASTGFVKAGAAGTSATVSGSLANTAIGKVVGYDQRTTEQILRDLAFDAKAGLFGGILGGAAHGSRSLISNSLNPGVVRAAGNLAVTAGEGAATYYSGIYLARERYGGNVDAAMQIQEMGNVLISALNAKIQLRTHQWTPARGDGTAEGAALGNARLVAERALNSNKTTPTEKIAAINQLEATVVTLAEQGYSPAVRELKVAQATRSVVEANLALRDGTGSKSDFVTARKNLHQVGEQVRIEARTEKLLSGISNPAPEVIVAAKRLAELQVTTSLTNKLALSEQGASIRNEIKILSKQLQEAHRTEGATARREATLTAEVNNLRKGLDTNNASLMEAVNRIAERRANAAADQTTIPLAELPAHLRDLALVNGTRTYKGAVTTIDTITSPATWLAGAKTLARPVVNGYEAVSSTVKKGATWTGEQLEKGVYFATTPAEWGAGLAAAGRLAVSPVSLAADVVGALPRKSVSTAGVVVRGGTHLAVSGAEAVVTLPVKVINTTSMIVDRVVVQPVSAVVETIRSLPEAPARVAEWARMRSIAKEVQFAGADNALGGIDGLKAIPLVEREVLRQKQLEAKLLKPEQRASDSPDQPSPISTAEQIRATEEYQTRFEQARRQDEKALDRARSATLRESAEELSFVERQLLAAEKKLDRTEAALVRYQHHQAPESLVKNALTARASSERLVELLKNHRDSLIATRDERLLSFEAQKVELAKRSNQIQRELAELRKPQVDPEVTKRNEVENRSNKLEDELQQAQRELSDLTERQARVDEKLTRSRELAAKYNEELSKSSLTREEAQKEIDSAKRELETHRNNHATELAQPRKRGEESAVRNEHKRLLAEVQRTETALAELEDGVSSRASIERLKNQHDANLAELTAEAALVEQARIIKASEVARISHEYEAALAERRAMGIPDNELRIASVDQTPRPESPPSWMRIAGSRLAASVTAAAVLLGTTNKLAATTGAPEAPGATIRLVDSHVNSSAESSPVKVAQTAEEARATTEAAKKSIATETAKQLSKKASEELTPKAGDNLKDSLLKKTFNEDQIFAMRLNRHHDNDIEQQQMRQQQEALQRCLEEEESVSKRSNARTRGRSFPMNQGRGSVGGIMDGEDLPESALAFENGSANYDRVSAELIRQRVRVQRREKLVRNNETGRLEFREGVEGVDVGKETVAGEDVNHRKSYDTEVA